jgi:hypothetical protein
MPVIGRLDDQVDAMLIKPLARSDEQAADTATALSHENIARPQTATQTAGESGYSADPHARHEELPVWLL